PVGPFGRSMEREGRADLLAQTDRDGFGKNDGCPERNAGRRERAFEPGLDGGAEADTDGGARPGGQCRTDGIADAETVAFQTCARREGSCAGRREVADVEILAADARTDGEPVIDLEADGRRRLEGENLRR